MGEKFDRDAPTKYITYLDANNLYGWAMCNPLPVGNFEWMSDSELKNWKNHSCSSIRPSGCILEVDLEYPEDLQDLHNDYPLAPERLKNGGVEKLIPNICNKSKYIIHHKTLKLYESLGLKIMRIHRSIKFEESAWLESYITLNTDLRTNAINDFEKDFFKLMNNSIFGKTMENIWNRVETNKTKFSKPVYCGMTILDLSKTLMYDFHYNYIKPKFGENAKLLFIGTDLLCYEIQTDDFFKDICEDVDQKFNLEFQQEKTKCNRDDERRGGGKIIKEFIGLRAKLYSYKMCEGKEKKKCKRIKKNVIKNKITHEDYKNCPLQAKTKLTNMNVIRSRAHNIYTEKMNKVAVSFEDDKRIILEDGVHTLAVGHFKSK